MYKDGKILIGKAGDKEVYIYPSMANRHGLIAGATGTGKTITLKVMAESFSDAGVPVFMADAKGDLSATCLPGSLNDSLRKRIEGLGMDPDSFDFHGYPVTYWDVFQKTGIPLRTTISEMGPLLLSRIMDLNDVQSDIMSILFKIADDEGLLLIDTKDLRSMILYVGDHADEYTLKYGNIAKQSLGAISRALTALESVGGDIFFGEPALNIQDWLSTDENGRGRIQLLDCRELMQNPVMYGTFLLWMLSELFETLPEAGDLDKPKMVFFFDEAHMLFESASKTLLAKVSQVVKLIRSKGVGIYFITQVPQDIPNDVLGQLGNKVQHALRAYTPADQKNAKAASESFRVNPEFDTYETLVNLGTGEAIVSVLDEKGIPTVVEKCTILPPQGGMGMLEDAVRDAQTDADPLTHSYLEMFDRDSAYEFLQRQKIADDEAAAQQKAEEEAAKQQALLEKEQAKQEAAAAKEQAKQEALLAKEREKLEKERQKAYENAEKARRKAEEQQAKAEEARRRKQQAATDKAAKSAAGTIGREVGKTLGGTLGGSFGRKLGGNVGSQLARGLMDTFLKR